MIDRYCLPEMKILWSEESKYAFWARVEKAHLECLIDDKNIWEKAALEFDQAVSKKTINDFLKKEQETGHDVIAFLSEISSEMPTYGHLVHKGLTSSDVLDTALSLRINQAIGLINDSIHSVLNAFKKQAHAHKHTICIGRTHGVHAEPMSFGQVLATYFQEFVRTQKQLDSAQDLFSFGKLSGAVGTYSQLKPDFEIRVLEKLKLKPEPIATQVIPRDKIVVLGNSLISLSNATERFALNFRHWARTELGEVLEPFGKKQKGSSAMPHKKNPILSENLCGLARVARGYGHMLSENTALWHERDISHSSVERIALPDLFSVVHFMLNRLCYLVENMQVNTEAMTKNLWATGGLWASQSVLTALIERGLNREKAYELVQSIALPLSHDVSKGRLSHDSFLNVLLSNAQIMSFLNETALKKSFDPSVYLVSVDDVFKRLF